MSLKQTPFAVPEIAKKLISIWEYFVASSFFSSVLHSDPDLVVPVAQSKLSSPGDDLIYMKCSRPM